MARRTTVVLSAEDVRALQAASRAEGLSQSELIRKGVRTVTAAYRRRPRPLVGWLKLSREERAEIEADKVQDYDR
jgi:hypothetical protein